MRILFAILALAFSGLTSRAANYFTVTGNVSYASAVAQPGAKIIFTPKSGVVEINGTTYRTVPITNYCDANGNFSTNLITSCWEMRVGDNVFSPDKINFCGPADGNTYSIQSLVTNYTGLSTNTIPSVVTVIYGAGNTTVTSNGTAYTISSSGGSAGSNALLVDDDGSELDFDQ